MEHIKRRKIEAAGGRVVTVAEFLQLTPEEEAIIEIRLALSKAVKKSSNCGRVSSIDSRFH
jgi:hypothetical protein